MMRRYFGIACVLAAVAVNSPAQAVSVDLGTLTSGESGSFPGFPDTGSTPVSVISEGSLAPDSEVVFTYTLSDLVGDSLATQIPSNSFPPATLASNSFGTTSSTPFSEAQVLASANLSSLSATGTTTATETIINNSGAAISFENFFNGSLASITGGVKSVTYGVSAVPLPAALSLFGTVMLGLFGFSWMRKRQNSLFTAI